MLKTLKLNALTRMGWFFGEIFNKKWFKGLQMRPYIKLGIS